VAWAKEAFVYIAPSKTLESFAPMSQLALRGGACMWLEHASWPDANKV